MNETQSDSQAQAEKSSTEHERKPESDVVFTTIYREDRDWLNKSKAAGQNRQDRLHEVIKLYRGEFGE